MDDAEVFPLIAPNDYATFRQLIGANMPDTYDKWRQLQTKELREFIQAGRQTREVPIDSNQFARFLSTRGANANLVSLRNCTIEIDAGYRY